MSKQHPTTTVIEDYDPDYSESERNVAITTIDSADNAAANDRLAQRRLEYGSLSQKDALTLLLERQSRTHKLSKEMAKQIGGIEERLNRFEAGRVELEQPLPLPLPLRLENVDEKNVTPSSSNCLAQPWTILVNAFRCKGKRSAYSRMERGEGGEHSDYLTEGFQQRCVATNMDKGD